MTLRMRTVAAFVSFEAATAEATLRGDALAVKLGLELSLGPIILANEYNPAKIEFSVRS